MLTNGTMQLVGPDDQPFQDEWTLMLEHLPLSGTRLLELGCGAAERTRQLAEAGGVDHIVAAEVDAKVLEQLRALGYLE